MAQTWGKEKVVLTVLYLIGTCCLFPYNFNQEITSTCVWYSHIYKKLYAENTVLFTASYTAQLGYFFSLLRLLVAVLHGLLCSSSDLIQIRLAGFPLEDPALERAVPSLQCRMYCSTHGLCCACFKTSSENKTFQMDFWQMYVQILKGGQRSLEKQQVELGLFDFFITFVLHYAVYDACSPSTSQCPPGQGAEPWHADAVLRIPAWLKWGCGTAEGQLPAVPWAPLISTFN